MKNNKQSVASVRIDDVAKLAGVSISTVSRVINGSGKVSKETTKKVKAVVESVGYIPNETARSLATNSNKIIGILIPDIFNGYYAELITYIEPLVSTRGYSLQLCITGGDMDKISYYIDDLIRRRAAGTIILSSRISDIKLIRRIKANMAVVAVEGDIDEVDCIRVENEKGMYDAVENLILCGHEKIGFIGYDLECKGLQDRLIGYRKALEAYHIPIKQEYIINIIDDKENFNPGYDATLHLLSLQDPPTAIQCMNEYCARGVYLALMESGKKIPSDMSVSAFDGQTSSRILNPRLTSAVIPIQDMAETAVSMLIRSIVEKSSTARHLTVFPVHLRQGDSVKIISKDYM